MDADRSLLQKRHSLVGMGQNLALTIASGQNMLSAFLQLWPLEE
jgi:hypothetical protein